MPPSPVKTRHGLRLAAAALLVVAVLSAGPARADMAPPLGYGGRLTDATGAPLAGPVDLAVDLFASATGGAPLDGAPFVFAGTKLQDGVFQLQLPAAGVLGLLGDGSQAVWVEVTDRTHGKAYPRQRFLMVPYAARVPVDGQTLSWNASGELTVGPQTAPGANQFLTKDAGGNLVWGRRRRP